MNSWERECARKFLRTKELLKTPEGRAIYESSKRKAEEENDGKKFLITMRKTVFIGHQ